MDAQTIGERLREPFPLTALGWKPQKVTNNRALAVPYIDARDVMDRLDDIVGVENWQDDYTFLPGGQVVCALRLKLGGEWVTKTDVGGESEQPDKGDREKAAVSDALKRAAVKFGIGRYLYSMPATWCDYDSVKKQFTQTPQVAAQFLPKQAGKSSPVKDNQPLRAQYGTAFTQAKTRADADKVSAAIAADMKAGLLSENDRLALRSVAEQTYARFPEQTAKA